MIRTVNTEDIVKNIKEMCIEANHYLSKDMDKALKDATVSEKSELGKKILNQLQENLKIAGYADYAAFRNFSGYRHTVEHSLYISPEYARQGLGKCLLQHLIAYAKQQGKHVMVAGIDHGNAASIALHQQFGFRQTGYMPQVGEKFGEWRDLVLMQLVLD